jgi:hypothetical protein
MNVIVMQSVAVKAHPPKWGSAETVMRISNSVKLVEAAGVEQYL